MTGSSDGGAASFRLEGRQLTVRLRAPLGGIPRSGTRVQVRCGDLAGAAWRARGVRNRGRQFAETPVNARPLVRRGQRVVSVRFRRDLAARANHCSLHPPRELGSGEALTAEMSLRRGAAPACRKSEREDVVLSTPLVLVTSVELEMEPDAASDHRACLRPAGRMQELLRTYSGRLRATTPTAVVAAGTWVAMGVRESSELGARTMAAWVEVRDLAAKGAASGRVRFDYADDGAAALTPRQLVLTEDGVVVFVLQIEAPHDGGVRVETRVEAGRPGGRAVTLATVPGDAIADLAISPDGRTATWSENGVPRSAQVP